MNAPRPSIDTSLWTTTGWRDEATAWIDARFAEAGIARTGAVEQPRVRPWGTVVRMPTDAGVVWLKACAPATAFEAAISPLLAERAPGAVLAPIATDASRGWLLLPDGGVHLGDVMEGEELVRAMTALLPRYAELQRAMAPAVDDLLAAGTLDLRPATLPDRFEEMLVATEGWAAQHGSAEDRAQHAGIAAARPRVTAWSERLAGSPVPPSIDHNDLHARNVLVRSRDDLDSARFYDWGDSVVAHPFTSLLIALRSMQDRLRVGPDDVALIRMRDAYLEVFDGSGSRADLVETVEIACHTGKIARAVVWNRALGTMALDEAGDFAGAPLYWLSQVLERSPLGDLDS